VTFPGVEASVIVSASLSGVPESAASASGSAAPESSAPASGVVAPLELPLDEPLELPLLDEPPLDEPPLDEPPLDEPDEPEPLPEPPPPPPDPELAPPLDVGSPPGVLTSEPAAPPSHAWTTPNARTQPRATHGPIADNPALDVERPTLPQAYEISPGCPLAAAS
jgi:hypothetical protein